ncbi:MAG TPA: hypothetical protein VNN10_02270, partial [Dehalococcoidia bacterium]|nr:hypothetical protein [Dehalococcoidia bacterium]
SCLWRPSTDALIWVQSFGLTPLGDDWAKALEGLLQAGHWATVAGAGLTVMLSRRARGAGLPLVLVVVFWTLAHVAFFGQPRYLLPVVPLLILTCTAALPPAPGPARSAGAAA